MLVTLKGLNNATKKILRNRHGIPPSPPYTMKRLPPDKAVMTRKYDDITPHYQDNICDC